MVRFWTYFEGGIYRIAGRFKTRIIPGSGPEELEEWNCYLTEMEKTVGI